jgi:hypothetical protein
MAVAVETTFRGGTLEEHDGLLERPSAKEDVPRLVEL